MGPAFANLAVNAATPDEQMRLAALFLARRPVKAVLFGLDAPWCAAHPAARTSHAFPDWLYEEGAPWGVLRQANLRGLTAAVNAVQVRFGHGRPRIRGDGYGVFTPPEASYDAARASAHIAAGSGDPNAPSDPPEAPFPALDALDAVLASLPPRRKRSSPSCRSMRGRRGNPERRWAAGRSLQGEGGGDRRAAPCPGHRLPPDLPVTAENTNYWDALHYRLPIAARVVAGLKDAARGGGDDPQGFYRVLAR